MGITLDQAKNLRVGQTIYSRTEKNADKTPRRYKVNGKPQTWKTRPDQVKVPVKFGLYSYSYITQDDLPDYSLTEK